MAEGSSLGTNCSTEPTRTLPGRPRPPSRSINLPLFSADLAGKAPKDAQPFFRHRGAVHQGRQVAHEAQSVAADICARGRRDRGAVKSPYPGSSVRPFLAHRSARDDRLAQRPQPVMSISHTVGRPLPLHRRRFVCPRGPGVLAPEDPGPGERPSGRFSHHWSLELPVWTETQFEGPVGVVSFLCIPLEFK